MIQYVWEAQVKYIGTHFAGANLLRALPRTEQWARGLRGMASASPASALRGDRVHGHRCQEESKCIAFGGLFKLCSSTVQAVPLSSF